jgi:hypothetical protein
MGQHRLKLTYEELKFMISAFAALNYFIYQPLLVQYRQQKRQHKNDWGNRETYPIWLKCCDRVTEMQQNIRVSKDLMRRFEGVLQGGKPRSTEAARFAAYSLSCDAEQESAKRLE